MPERMVQIITQSVEWLRSGGLMRSLDKAIVSPFCEIHLSPRIELLVRTLPSHDVLGRRCPEADIRASPSPFLNASRKLCCRSPGIAAGFACCQAS